MFVSPTDPNTGALIQMPGLENPSEPGEGGLPAGGLKTPSSSSPITAEPRANTPCVSDIVHLFQLNYASGAYAQAVEQLGSTFQDSLNDMMNTAGNPRRRAARRVRDAPRSPGQAPCPPDHFVHRRQLWCHYCCQKTPPAQIQTPVAAANLCPQLSLQGLGRVRRGQLQDHASVDPQCRSTLRALRRAAQQPPQSRLELDLALRMRSS